MFTGLVQGKGTVLSQTAKSNETRFTIRPGFAMPKLTLGESVAVNGVCLTVESFDADPTDKSPFSVYASAESMTRSNLGGLKAGSIVNLERALALGDRLGGHLVSGHVDCLARVVSTTPAGESTIYRLSFPADFAAQVIPKGSVALDGISLTINYCGPDFLEVNIIPATQKETTVSLWKPGVSVNMETDMIGKYVQRMLAAWKGEPDQASGPTGGSGLTEDFLRKHGF